MLLAPALPHAAIVDTEAEAGGDRAVWSQQHAS